jgi:hypothetical protein
VRVAYIVSGLDALAGEFAASCHGSKSRFIRALVRRPKNIAGWSTPGAVWVLRPPGPIVKPKAPP